MIEKNALPVHLATSEPALGNQIAAAWRLPTPSAYSEAEIGAQVEWVQGGGSLLILLDHMPFPGAVQELAGRFGVTLGNGLAVEQARASEYSMRALGRAALLRFSVADGSLARHPITNGRNASERVEQVETYGGSAFRLPPGAVSLMTFGPGYVQMYPEVMWQFSDATPRDCITGWSQGCVLQAGLGRVAIIGEVGVFGVSPDQIEKETNPQSLLKQNHQLRLNVLRWLTGRLEEPSSADPPVSTPMGDASQNA